MIPFHVAAVYWVYNNDYSNTPDCVLDEAIKVANKGSSLWDSRSSLWDSRKDNDPLLPLPTTLSDRSGNILPNDSSENIENGYARRVEELHEGPELGRFVAEYYNLSSPDEDAELCNLPSPDAEIPSPDEDIEEALEVNYMALQKRERGVVLEQIAELYNLYFPNPRSEEEWQTFFDIFKRAFRWGATAIAGGVLGNLAYEVLKKALLDALLAHKNSKRKDRKSYWENICDEYVRISEYILRITKEGRMVRAQEVQDNTGIESRERVKQWMKIFGGVHIHAGRQACCYRFVHKEVS